MRYIVGIDQGGTKTVAAIADETGKLLGVGWANGANHAASGMVQAMRQVQQAVRAARETAGLHDAAFELAVGGISGADFDFEYRMLEGALSKALGLERVLIKNDCIIAMRAGASKAHGAVLCAGTGLNCAVRNRDGQEFIFGYAIRDAYQGGGAIGVDALYAVIEADACVSPPTMLTQRLLERYGYTSSQALLQAHIQGEVSKDSLKHLVPVVAECADQGDAVAGDILRSFAKACARLVIGGMRKLGMERDDCDLVVSGSVFKCKWPGLIGTLEAEVLTACPNTRIVDARYEPIVGSVLMGLEALGAGGAQLGAVRQNVEQTAAAMGLLR